MRLVWTAQANRDLVSIARFIRAENPAAALEMGLTIRRSVEHLPQFPTMGRMGQRPGTRELVIVGTPYVVVYSVVGDAVRIMTILHGARQRP